MANNRINLLAFQVNHMGYDAYDDFATEMSEIVKKTVEYRGAKEPGQNPHPDFRQLPVGQRPRDH